jgi:DNA polymerase-3 subunit alpha (Gram-positive type)
MAVAEERTLPSPWSELLAGDRVRRVLVNPVRGTWQVYLTGGGFTPEVLEQLREALLRSVTALNSVELLVEEVTPEVRSVLEELRRRAPLAAGLLAGASFYGNGTGWTVILPNQLVHTLWHRQGYDRLFSQVAAEVRGRFVPVRWLCGREENPKAPPAERSAAQVFLGGVIEDPPVAIAALPPDAQGATVSGRVLGVRAARQGRGLWRVYVDLTDETDSLTVVCQLGSPPEQREWLRKGRWLKARGQLVYDGHRREVVLAAADLNGCPAPCRRDAAPEKRVELHLHTRMSAMDAVTAAEDYIRQAAAWGHPAVAITDHGVVQAFPEAMAASARYGIKVLYGMEAYVIDEVPALVSNAADLPLAEAEFVVVDVETTGLRARSDEIIEIGAVKIRGGSIVDRFHSLVRPRRGIPDRITRLTGITEEMVRDAPPAREVLARFAEFLGRAVLVAHNASFDAGFLEAALERELHRTLDVPVLDTLGLVRSLHPSLRTYRLSAVAAHFGVPYATHHRAPSDAEATAGIFLVLLPELAARGIRTLAEVNRLVREIPPEKLRPFHVTILVENQKGLENLYRLVTWAHLEHFYRHPRIPRSLLQQYREGLLIGSACESGELFQACLAGAAREKLEELAAFYDYLEIQPIANHQFLVTEGQLQSVEELMEINRTIVEIGERTGRPVVATGDVHFLNPTDGIYRRILRYAQGYQDPAGGPPLYFRTTDEMLEEFAYLGPEKAYEVVVANPQRIAARVADVKPVPDGVFHPHWPGAEEEIRRLARERAEELYGRPLPEPVAQRLERELEAITGNGFAVLYLVARMLVARSLADGYPVGSRGSVGSSLVATLIGITEVNPLPPHYVCPRCHYFEMVPDCPGSGPDLPPRSCPGCGHPCRRDGHNIPFEVFLGIDADKVPDIDLNFSGEYQGRAHRYTEELFGRDNVFRAGTINTVAEKTAYGFVKNYLEGNNLQVRSAELQRLVEGCTGVKRTTGQHPGGLMIVPAGMDVHRFTPLQYPADDKRSGVVTTHFDYHAISNRLIKLDVLGHDDPTVIKMLQDLTGVDPREIPLDEPKTMALFSGTEPLGVDPAALRSPVGTYGIPEFGTRFVRQMLAETRPRTFGELVRISGFSHGTGVWLNNARDLIRQGICRLSEAIATRDDIMNYLLARGMSLKRAFAIMERVRKGQGLTPEDRAEMQALGVPSWFIGSCMRIEYLFPKAHAVAYVMMAFRIAYFKVYHPEPFYAAYFTVRADDLDSATLLAGPEAVVRAIEAIEKKGPRATPKEKGLLPVLEVALEMYLRGFKFRPVDLAASHATRFLVTPEGLLLPFVALPGVGRTAAENIVRAREAAPFRSVEDLQERARLSRSVIQVLETHGCLVHLNGQMSWQGILGATPNI